MLRSISMRCGDQTRPQQAPSRAQRHAYVRACRRRRDAAERACRESDFRDAARRGSRFSACEVARDRRADGFLRRPLCPTRYARSALLRVRADARPFRGGFNLTPERRAFDRPMAMACSVERAPCFPRRMCSISSRTNSPACVVGALPCRFAFRARFSVVFSGMHTSSPKRVQIRRVHMHCQVAVRHPARPRPSDS